MNLLRSAEEDLTDFERLERQELVNWLEAAFGRVYEAQVREGILYRRDSGRNAPSGRGRLHSVNSPELRLTLALIGAVLDHPGDPRAAEAQFESARLELLGEEQPRVDLKRRLEMPEALRELLALPFEEASEKLYELAGLTPREREVTVLSLEFVEKRFPDGTVEWRLRSTEEIQRAMELARSGFPPVLDRVYVWRAEALAKLRRLFQLDSG